MTEDDPRHQTSAQKWRTVRNCVCLHCEAARATRRRNYKLKRRAHTDHKRVATHIDNLLRDGWTQSEIVAASGVSAPTVSEIRRGIYNTTRVETAVAILSIAGPAPRSWRVPSEGTIRRIQALAALGWTVRETCRAAGLSERFYAELVDKDRATLSRTSADAVARVYELRSMLRPPNGAHRTRAQNIARDKGWPPPLAWDDIDDPNEQPVDWHYTPTPRVDQLTDLVASGANLTHATRRLGVSVNTLNKWCGHTGNRHLYLALAVREGDWNSSGRIARDGAA